MYLHMPLPRNAFFVYCNSFPLLKYSPIFAVYLPVIFAWSDLILRNTSSGCLVCCFAFTKLKKNSSTFPILILNVPPLPLVAAELLIFSPTPSLHVDISNHVPSLECIVLYPTPAAVLLVGHVPSTVVHEKASSSMIATRIPLGDEVDNDGDGVTGYDDDDDGHGRRHQRR